MGEPNEVAQQKHLVSLFSTTPTTQTAFYLVFVHNLESAYIHSSLLREKTPTKHQNLQIIGGHAQA